MDKLATCLPYIKVSFKTSTILPFSLSPKGMTVYKHMGIIWGILVSSFTWANDLEENDWPGAVVKQEHSQPVASGSRQSPQSSAAMMSPRVCSVMEMPRLTSGRPEGSFLFFTLSTGSWRRNQPLHVPSMSKLRVSSSPLGLGNHVASLHSHLHLQHGRSQEETQSYKFTESSPTLTGLLVPSLL